MELLQTVSIRVGVDDIVDKVSVLIVERCGTQRILCTLAFNTDGLCRESDWREAILCDRVMTCGCVSCSQHSATSFCVTLFRLHFSNTVPKNGTWFTVYSLLFCGGMFAPMNFRCLEYLFAGNFAPKGESPVQVKLTVILHNLRYYTATDDEYFFLMF